jgi:TatD DNase family protein
MGYSFYAFKVIGEERELKRTHRMRDLPSLDAHAHLDCAQTENKLAESGSVLAMTLSLEEAALALGRHDQHVAWGVGCHPRKLTAQKSFDAGLFRDLAERTAVVGEVGLDFGSHYSHASSENQLQVFRRVLKIVSDLPRIMSIHSYLATGLVIKELTQNPIDAPILHWWTGNVAETRDAVALGCYFSVHSAVARHSKFRTTVPADRILIESDHGLADPPEAIPCRIEWTEHLVARQYSLDRRGVRRLAWRNLSIIVKKTNTHNLLPEPFFRRIVGACSKTGNE